jgi:hypothetical protein
LVVGGQKRLVVERKIFRGVKWPIFQAFYLAFPLNLLKTLGFYTFLTGFRHFYTHNKPPTNNHQPPTFLLVLLPVISIAELINL